MTLDADLARYRRMIDPQQPPATYAQLLAAVADLCDKLAWTRWVLDVHTGKVRDD